MTGEWNTGGFIYTMERGANSEYMTGRQGEQGVTGEWVRETGRTRCTEKRIWCGWLDCDGEKSD